MMLPWLLKPTFMILLEMLEKSSVNSVVGNKKTRDKLKSFSYRFLDLMILLINIFLGTRGPCLFSSLSLMLNNALLKEV